MAKHVRARRQTGEATPGKDTGNDPGDLSRGPKRSEWRLNAQKDPVRCDDRTHIFDIGQQRIPSILWYWYQNFASGFAMQSQPTRTPVNV